MDSRRKNTKVMEEIMDKMLEKILHAEFPELFVEKDLPETKSCMAHGCAHGDGWYDILHELCFQVTQISKDAKFTQVKEKFGTLSVYFETPNPADFADISKLCSEALAKSEVTCESCGIPGTLRTRGWWKTLCDHCEEDLLGCSDGGSKECQKETAEEKEPNG
jgi:hypothetical protein